jgi:hypothetical protein
MDCILRSLRLYLRTLLCSFVPIHTESILDPHGSWSTVLIFRDETYRVTDIVGHGYDIIEKRKIMFSNSNRRRMLTNTNVWP